MFFVKLYRYFQQHKILLYTLLVFSSAVFVFYGLKLHFEEDLSQLLPASESNDSGLVFGNLKVKDKIFMQMTGAEPEIMAGYVDELMDSILVQDEDIANTLYKVDADLAISALDYALMHVPSFVDTSLYASFDSAIAHADETMAHNQELIMNDETGSVTQMVTTDPLNLRSCLLPDMATGLGFTIIDGHLFCHDSTVALMFLSPQFQSFDSHSGARLMKHINHCVQQFSKAHPDVQVYMHGAPVRSGDNSRIMKRDIFLTIAISILLIFLGLCVSFKSGNVIWQNLLPVTYGTFFALACMYWIKGSMSLMAMGIGTVVLGTAISYCLHVLVHLRFVGEVEKMLTDEAVPVCLGCLTTIGAFLGLMFTQSELLKDFGLFSTFALIGNTFFALVFLPHFLRDGHVRRTKKIFRTIDKINSFPYDRNPFVIGSLVVVILIGFVMSPKVEFDNNLKHIGYESDNLHKSEELYAEKCIGADLQRYYAVNAPDLDAALDDNDRLASLLDSLQKSGDITEYVPVVSVMFRSEQVQAQRIAAWRSYWSPEKLAEAEAAIRAAAINYELDPSIFAPFHALVEADYEPGNLYGEGFIPDGLICNFIEESDGKYLIFNSVKMPEANKQKIDDCVAAMPHAVVVDPFYYTGNMISLIHTDFSTTLWISSLFVLVVLLIAFRDPLIALLAFLPMFISWYVVQGWMAIFHLPFNLINIVISTFIFGIGVDYSIFVMKGLLSEVKNDDSTLLDYHKVAVFFSAFVLIVVVVSMLFATHPVLKSIGVCTLIGMLSTILITYSLQPLFFRLLLKIPIVRKRLRM